MLPLLSVVIPAYNRVGPLRQTLASVAAASSEIPTEIIVVDDGSTPALEVQLGPRPELPQFSIITQPNSGPIAARLTGLNAAKGKYVLFLDSDDLVHPDKFKETTSRLESDEADVVYDDMAIAIPDGEAWRFEPSEALPRVSDPAEFYLKVQPAPHSPVYRREYLLRHLSQPLFQPERRFDPAGDVWIYYNLCVFPAKIVKLDRPLSAIGPHAESRFSLQWEKLAVASLAIMEAFHAACPRVVDLVPARTVFGECAFASWRRLPGDFSPLFAKRMLRLWRENPPSQPARLGGPVFQRLARVFGLERAGKLLRLRNKKYAEARTVSDEELQRLLASLT